MTPEYIIMTSDYQIGAGYAKELGLEIHQWHWIRDRFKEPIAYKRYNHQIVSNQEYTRAQGGKQ